MKRQPNKVDAKVDIKVDRGDVIFFYPRPTNLFQKGISYFDGKYFHCGIMLSSDLVLSMTRKGVVIEHIENYKKCKYDVYELQVDNQEKEQLLKLLISSMSYLKYDYSGVASFVFRFIPQNPCRFYCSEFLCWGFYYIGLLPDNLNSTPTQLSNQDFLTYKTKGVI